MRIDQFERKIHNSIRFARDKGWSITDNMFVCLANEKMPQCCALSSTQVLVNKHKQLHEMVRSSGYDEAILYFANFFFGKKISNLHKKKIAAFIAGYDHADSIDSSFVDNYQILAYYRLGKKIRRQYVENK